MENVRGVVSVSKMSVGELRSYTAQLDNFLKSPNAAGIRICECCIKIAAPPVEK